LSRIIDCEALVFSATSSETKHESYSLFVGHSIMHTGCEKFIAEEVQGTKEDNSGIVPGLESGYQQSVFADSMWILQIEF
jgi:hypothetical protein